MAAPEDHYYWDTCVFIAFLNGEHDKHGRHVDHIGQFLEDCRAGRCRIYTSTATIVEIPARKLTSDKYGTFSEFLADYEGAIVQVGADPIIMATAAELRNLTYTKGPDGDRPLGTLDAIHLASALALIGSFEVPLTAFHTFDNGKSRDIELRTKTVPLITFETWCESCGDDPLAKRVMAMKRSKPDHPDPRLPLEIPPADKAHPAGPMVAANTNEDKNSPAETEQGQEKADLAPPLPDPSRSEFEVAAAEVPPAEI